jgi:hypothetical protein
LILNPLNTFEALPFYHCSRIPVMLFFFSQFIVARAFLLSQTASKSRLQAAIALSKSL